jgi:hypothetical protein
MTTELLQKKGSHSGAEAHGDLIDFVPGINPRPTAPGEFFRSL